MRRKKRDLYTYRKRERERKRETVRDRERELTKHVTKSRLVG